MESDQVPIEHEIARAAQRAVEDQLAPCISTRLGQGDDYGIDAFVQHVLPGRPPRRTEVVFGLQVKGHQSNLAAEHKETLTVARLLAWAAMNMPIIIAVYSVATKKTRWRLATDVVAELSRNRPQWKTQVTTIVLFGQDDERIDGNLHEWLRRVLASATDFRGGQTKFHKSIKSVLLTELYHGYAHVGQRFDISDRPSGPAVAHVVTGMQWSQGEIDERAVVAHRVLAGALLLFDEVYFPVSLSYAAVGALGPALFMQLLNSRRLVPIASAEQELAFVTGTGNVGDIYFFSTKMNDVYVRELNGLADQYNLSSQFATTVLGAIRYVDYGVRVAQELLSVSKLSYIRDLLGLGIARPQAHEPAWAAERMLRIGNVVKFYAAADQLNVDVVEFEPGLSRIALARWGSAIRFHRIFQALDELQMVFSAAGLPDLGLLSERIGIRRCIEIANSSEGIAFRGWYWEAASDAVAQRGSFEGEVARRLKMMTKESLPIPNEFLVAISDVASGFEGLSARPGGEESLKRQSHFNEQRLINMLTRTGAALPAESSPCPCGSESTFAKCCGKIVTQGEGG